MLITPTKKTHHLLMVCLTNSGFTSNPLVCKIICQAVINPLCEFFLVSIRRESCGIFRIGQKATFHKHTWHFGFTDDGEVPIFYMLGSSQSQTHYAYPFELQWSNGCCRYKSKSQSPLLLHWRHCHREFLQTHPHWHC